jgi:hypothetical protein
VAKEVAMRAIYVTTKAAAVVLVLSLFDGSSVVGAQQPSLDPKRETVFITGNIEKPGEWSYEPKMTVGDLVKIAGGVRLRAKTTAVFTRHTADRSRSPGPAQTTDELSPSDTVVVTLKPSDE